MKMKSLALVVALACGCMHPAQARHANVEIKQVPISRLLTNLTARLSTSINNDDKAMLEFQIGRLHSMAYALRTEEVSVRTDRRMVATPKGAGDSRNSVLVPWYGYSVSDYDQFQIEPTEDQAKIAQAKKHLAEATLHLEKACTLNPKLETAQLGWAWCLQQTGQFAKARPLYRQIFKNAYEKEKSEKSGFRGSSIAIETGEYLISVLDKKRDAGEIADIRLKMSQVSEGFRMVTPIVVPLRPGLNAQQLMCSRRVVFDLDGNGPRPYGSWTTADAGWLVFDGDGKGDINSGLQLFGCSTFWVFWRNGYEALSALDADNDGLIQGDEKAGLKIWQDLNQNGISESGEVKSLDQCGIESLSCLSKTGADGQLYSEAGVKYRSGEAAPTYDWMVEQVK